MFNNLKKVLIEKGVSQKDLAETLGISRNALEQKLKGESRFNGDEIDKIMNMNREYTYFYLFAKSAADDVA